jgi:hypothetical protein
MLTQNLKAALSIPALACLFVFAGCAGDKGANRVAPQAPNASALKNTKKDVVPVSANVVRSVFTIDEHSRDPFNPQSRKVAAANGIETPARPVAIDFPALLTDALQGIGGTADHRIAIMNNVLVEAGRPARIPVKVGNQARSIPVRCREIGRNTVTLDVEGYGPLLIKRKETL